jgi:hypothetical protein
MVNPHYSLIIHDLAFRLSNGIDAYISTKKIRNIKLDEKNVLTWAGVETLVFGQELKN